MRLVPRLTLLFMVCIAVLLSGRGLLRVRHQSAAFENDMLRDHRFIGRALAADLAEIWRAEGEPRAQHLVDIAGRTAGPGINLSWLSQAELASPARPSGDLAAALAGNEVQHFDADALRSYFPVRAGDLGGALLISESLAERNRYVRASTVHASISLALVLLCCGAFAMLLSRWLVAMPVRRLIDKAQRVAGGDFSTPLTLPRDDEFQSLAIEMNAMCDALAKAKADFAAEAQARQSATEQLRHAERLSTVGKLAAGIAHELGTPLSIVSGHAEMIVNGEVRGHRVIESATVIAREAQRIARIVRSLLGFARRKGPEGEPCDVAQTVQRCISLLRPMAEKANLEFLLESARDCRASIDQDSLQQVTTNLLSNAMQAMTSGGRIQLKVSRVLATPPKPLGAAAGRCIRLDVTDHGAGIAPEVLPHIFEPFFSTKGPSDGTGLGLSVVYGIVEDHHGFISVESTVDRGSVFSVFLPMAGAP